MPLPRLRTSLRAQLVATGAGAVAVTAALLTAVGGWQVTGLASDAGDDVDRLVSDSMAQTTHQAVTLVETQVATVTDRMASDLRVAQQTFAQSGAVSFGVPERWTVTDQTTQEQTEVDLPQLLVGGTWLGRTVDPASPVPVVDEISSLLGAAVTVFQRVDQDGDMLRVATSVTNDEGNRVIGTAIGATGADGTPNAVVSALLSGEAYYGTALVVGQPYVTAYAPLLQGEEVVGALFVGVPQSEVDEPLRAALDEENSPLALTCQGFVEGTDEFLHAAQRAGSARPDVRGRDLFLAVLAITWVRGAAMADESSGPGLAALLRTGWSAPRDQPSA